MSFNPSKGRWTGRFVVIGAMLALAGCGTRQMPEELPPPPASATRGGAAQPTYLVRSASSSVLARFPRGTAVDRGSEICLEESEQLTLSGSNGQSVTYRGPGCLRRNTRPTPQNLGGFTFGWNGFGSEDRATAR